MPIITLCTNLPSSKLNNAFRRAFLTVVAETLQKPVDATALIVHAGPECCQLGLDLEQPTMMLNIKSIGQLSAAENVAHSKKICDFIEAELGICSSRVYIHFQCLESHEVGKAGTTVKALKESGK